ncbi:unnamed protein product [Phyllotreta striolata]|uniref:BAG domain-containing protein n=1 Tax=Phyllotreta striolata TaxID=444603 RepID=A0A9N9TSM0_PHYSR|nr:unnamed protein product [Phyllotreta striolata]
MSFPRSPYTGFPFDEETPEEFPFNSPTTRGANLQSTLDDIARRHPKIAEHLTNFNSPRTDRSRFPFDRDFDRYSRQFYEHPEDLLQSREFQRNPRSFYEHPEDHSQAREQHNTHPEQPKGSSDIPETRPEQSPGQTSNLQQSDSFDSTRRPLGVDERSPRCSSAPPGGDINIDRELKEPPGNMAREQGKPVERIIPILLEGSEEPIVPKTSGSSRQEPPQASNRRGFDEDQPDHAGASSKQNVSSGARVPVQQDVLEEHEQPKLEQSEPPGVPLSPIEQIQAIKRDVSELLDDVEKFSGATKDKRYLYLDEMLTRNLLKLDDIDTQGRENVRACRKEAIKCIQGAICLLENKVKCGESGKSGQCGNVDESSQTADCAGCATDEAGSETRAVLVSDDAEKMENRAVLVSDKAETSDANKETRAVLVDGPQDEAPVDSKGVNPAVGKVQETDDKKENKGK